jgi:glucan 1,3-beta-glucosidase
MSDINSETNRLNVGSVTLIDSTFRNTDVAIKTGWGPNTLPSTANSLILENIRFESCPVTIQGAGNSILFPGAGGSSQWIPAWGIGHGYTTTGGPTYLEGDRIPAAPRPSVLTAPDGRFYTHSKPQYQTLTKDNFLSVRAFGAVGNAQADDADALQRAIDAAVTQGKVLFLDYGLYRVTRTIQIPPGARIVGESYPVILSSGPFFADMNNPRPVVQVGRYSGQPGRAELVDFIVSTQGRQPGAIGIEWNLASPTNEPSGMWDAHVRIGGFEGTQQQVAECLKQPGSPEVKPQCVVAFMAMHVTEKARGLYMENVWLWTADHDIDDPQNTQITIFTGRGLCKCLQVSVFPRCLNNRKC